MPFARYLGLTAVGSLAWNALLIELGVLLGTRWEQVGPEAVTGSQTAFSARRIAHAAVDLTPPWRAPRAPVVFLHGVGTDRYVWAGWLGEVAPRHPILTVDLRGLGASAPLPEEEAGLLDVLVDDLLDLVPAGRPAHLVGESTGGVVALAAALADPARVATVTVCNTPLAGRGTVIADGWAEQLAAGSAVWSARLLEDRFAQGAVDGEVTAWVDGVQRRADPAAVLALARMLSHVDLRPRLAGLSVPLLALVPEASPFVALDAYDDLAASLPTAELVRFPGVRHGLVLSHAATCARTLVDFLARRG